MVGVITSDAFVNGRNPNAHMHRGKKSKINGMNTPIHTPRHQSLGRDAVYGTT